MNARIRARRVPRGSFDGGTLRSGIVASRRRVNPVNVVSLNGYGAAAPSVTLRGLAAYAPNGLGSWLSDVLKGKNNNPLGTVIGAVGNVIGGVVGQNNQPSFQNPQPAQFIGPVAPQAAPVVRDEVPGWVVPVAVGAGLLLFAAVVRK